MSVVDACIRCAFLIVCAHCCGLCKMNWEYKGLCKRSIGVFEKFRFLCVYSRVVLGLSV